MQNNRLFFSYFQLVNILFAFLLSNRNIGADIYNFQDGCSSGEYRLDLPLHLTSYEMWKISNQKMKMVFLKLEFRFNIRIYNIYYVLWT